MKNLTTRMLMLVFVLSISFAWAQEQEKSENQKTKKSMETPTLKTYLIERDIPDAGKLTSEQLKNIAITSNNVLTIMGPQIEWLHSYVTEDKIYCVYKATSKEVIKEHAEKGGFPANSISEMSTEISPATAE